MNTNSSKRLENEGLMNFGLPVAKMREVSKGQLSKTEPKPIKAGQPVNKLPPVQPPPKTREK